MVKFTNSVVTGQVPVTLEWNSVCFAHNNIALSSRGCGKIKLTAKGRFATRGIMVNEETHTGSTFFCDSNVETQGLLIDT